MFARLKGPTKMQTADVVIVGGGIVGASIAWHLTEAGCRNVLIVERETHQGKGSTGKSMGGVRAQFATRPNIQMSLYSIPFYAVVRRAPGAARRLSRTRLPVCRDEAGAPRLPADESGAAEIAGPDAGADDFARRHRRYRAAVAFRRHSRRQLLPHGWLRRSQQRDGRLHHIARARRARRCGVRPRSRRFIVRVPALRVSRPRGGR